MIKQNFLAAIGIVLLCFIAANGAMAKWSHHVDSTQKLDLIDRARDANVLLLGNSLMQFSVDPQLFEQAARQQSQKLIPVNAALWGTFALEHYLLFKEAVRNQSIHTVIVGFFDFQLSAIYHYGVSGFLTNRTLAFDPRVSTRDVESIYELSLAESFQFRIFRWLPLLAYRSSVWESVERFRIRWGDPAADFDADTENGFNRESRLFGDVPSRFNPPMERIVEESQMRGYRLIFVLMPVSPRHVTTCYLQPRWVTYLGSLRKLMEERRCGFIDASQWYPSQSRFKDSVHIQFGSGFFLFSPDLARAVIAELPAMESRWPDR